MVWAETAVRAGSAPPGTEAGRVAAVPRRVAGSGRPRGSSTGAPALSAVRRTTHPPKRTRRQPRPIPPAARFGDTSRRAVPESPLSACPETDVDAAHRPCWTCRGGTLPVRAFVHSGIVHSLSPSLLSRYATGPVVDVLKSIISSKLLSISFESSMVFRVPPAVMKIALTLASLNLRRSSGFLLIFLSRVMKSQFLPFAPTISKIPVSSMPKGISEMSG